MARKKLKIEFDEKKRKEYLTGFHKRKEERRKLARQIIEEKIKEQRKALRDQKRIEKKATLPFELFPEPVIAADGVGANSETVDLPDHIVTVSELGNLEAAQKELFLGRNQAHEPSDSANRTRVADDELSVGDGAAADPKKLKRLERMYRKVKGVKSRKNPHFKPNKAKKGSSKS